VAKLLISPACCSMVSSIRLKEVISVPTSSFRRPSPEMARSLASISAMRATVRPTSQMM